jgi:hypothetical protein
VLNGDFEKPNLSSVEGWYERRRHSRQPYY